MGYPMAGHLRKAGYETVVFNRTRARAEEWQSTYNGSVCDTPREAASAADYSSNDS